MTDPALKVQTVKVESLTPDPHNARKHNQKNLDAIRFSLDRFGQRRPLVVHGDVVIAGNGTLEDAKALGWTHVAVTRTPADWTYEEARAYALADNRTAELAEWDSTILAEHMLELDAAGWSMADLGFDITEEDEAQVVQDEVPDPPQTSRSKPGQLWDLGGHRLLVGDSTDADDVARLMAGELADCIFTDPPYNVAYVGGTKDALTIENDEMSEDDFATFIRSAYDRMFEAAAPGAGIYVCHSDTGGGIFRKALVDSGFYLKQCLIWVKDTFVLSRQDYHWQHEPILYGWKPGAAHSWYGRRVKATVLDEETDLASLKKADLLAILEELRESSTVIREDKPRRNAEHPTMKPVPLVARMLANSTKRGDVVFDPFGGSGSTLIAAAQMDRRCYTIEKDPRYADVIIDRWEKLAQAKAEVIVDDEG